MPESSREDSAFDPNGQLITQTQFAIDGSQHTIVNDWDRQRRLAREVDRFGAETLHEYDAQDNRIARSDPAGRSVFVFDQLNRLRSVSTSKGQV